MRTILFKGTHHSQLGIILCILHVFSILFGKWEQKKYFAEHHTPDSIHGFGDSVLVCKMYDLNNIPFLSIQAMQAITMNRLDLIKRNRFKMLLNVLALHILIQII